MISFKKFFIKPILESTLEELESFFLHFSACVFMGIFFGANVAWSLNLFLFIFNFWNKTNFAATLITSFSIILVAGFWV